MQSLEAISKVTREIAARTHGQTAEVRTFMGRQLLFLKNSTELFMLPALDAVQVQDNEEGSPTFGMFYYIPDFDPADNGNPIL